MSSNHINFKKITNITISKLNQQYKFTFQLKPLDSLKYIKRSNTMPYIKKTIHNNKKNTLAKISNIILITNNSNDDTSQIKEISLPNKKKGVNIYIENPNNNYLDKDNNLMKKNDIEQEQLYKNDSININDNEMILNNNNNKENKKYYNCFLCERTYEKEILFFPECEIHPFCKGCLYLYYKVLTENKNLDLKCPVKNCLYNVDLDKLNRIIDIDDFNELKNSKSYKKENKNHPKNKNKNNTFVYFKNSVLEIDSKESLVQSIKDKKKYCPKCLMPIYKSNNNFYKCLNCYYKQCKFCSKEYTNTHLICNEKDYCKVYLRSTKPKRNYIKIFFKQLILVLGIFILCIFSAFIIPFQFLKKKFKIENNKIKNKSFYIKIFFSYCLSIIIMIIIIPFIIILFPYFPYFIAFLDF